MGAPAVPRAVWLIVGLHVLLMTGYTILVPNYRGPDEPLHVDMVLALRDGYRYPNLGERFVSLPVSASMSRLHYRQLQAPHLTADGAGVRSDRPSFDELGPDGPSKYRNYLTQHPPLYYYLQRVASGAITRLTGGQEAWPYDRFVALLRLIDVVLMAPLPLLAFAVVRRLGHPDHTAIGAAVFLLAIPELSHFGGIVNNDDLLLPLFGVLTLLLTRVMTGDLSKRTSLLTGVVGGLALLTKGFALMVPLWFLLAYLVAGRERREAVRMIAGRLGIAVGTTLAIGGWWWVRNVVLYGALQPSLQDVAPKFIPKPAGFVPNVWWWLQRFVSAMTERFWSWIGGYGGRLPVLVILVATAITVGAVVVALTRAGSARRTARLAILLFPIPAVVAIVGPPALQAYLRTSLTPAMQGRYLFVAVVGLAAVVAIGLAHLAGRRARDLPWLMLAAAGVIQLFAMWRILHSFWGPAGSSIAVLARAMVAWSPWPPVVVIAVAVLGVVAAVLTAVELRPRRARGGSPTPEKGIMREP